MIAGLLLAAGRSSRFGGDKLRATIKDVPIIRWSAAALAPLDDVIVITGEGDALTDVLRGMQLRFVCNAARDSGLSSSIRTGMGALAPDTEAVIIALGDQPFVSRDAVRELVGCWRAQGADIVAPVYADGRGHPVLFAARCFASLAGLTGDAGARALIEGGAFHVANVRVAGRMPVDVDTPEALALAAQRATDDASISPPSV